MSTFAERLAQLGRPDILLIITDQERAIQHFPEGWEQANLPSMQRLKRRGFHFERAFCNSCMCSPSRATLFTGTYPAQHQVTQTLTTGGKYSDAETELSNTLPNLARMLDGAGYDVHYRGKWHLSKGANGGELVSSDIAMYGFRGWEAPDAGEDTQPENFGGGFANHDLDYVRQAIAFLGQVREHRARHPREQHVPYCLVLSLVNPHDVLCYPNGFDYGYGPEWLRGDIQLPATVGEKLLESQKPMAQRQALLVANKALGHLPTDDDKRSYLNFYGNTIKLADREIGKVLDALDEPGPGGSPSLAQQAVVLRMADHGEMGMAHGGMRQKAFVAYEEVLRVPLIVSNPVLFPPAHEGQQERRSTAQLASLIDVLPTVAALTGATPPAGLRGTDLTPLFERDEPVQDAILFTFDDTKASASNVASAVHAANRLRCLRTREWKYVEYFHALGAYPTEYELYHLTHDPDERHNLAYDPAHAARRDELARQLRQQEQQKLLRQPGRAADGTAYRRYAATHPASPDPEAEALLPEVDGPGE